MQKKLQSKMKLSYSNNVIDIVQFGSSIFESLKPNDIDIAVIFKKIPLKEQLEEAQNIKRQLEKEFNLPIHIKSYDFYSFFDEGNFARENIFFYGRSLISGEYFSKNFGLTPKIQIIYSLKKLEKKDKVRFNYLLNGRMKEYGLLRKYGGRLICPGMIEIIPEYEKIFIDAMKKISHEIISKRILI